MKITRFLLFSTLLFSCSGKPTSTDSVIPTEKAVRKTDTSSFVCELIFGRYCGECFGICAPMFSLSTCGNASRLYADFENSFFEQNKEGFATDLSLQREKLNLAYQVMKKLPKSLLNNEKDKMTFGCPDCTDGCGIYIHFTEKTGGKSKTYHLDRFHSKDMPDEIFDYSKFVDSIVNELLK